MLCTPREYYRISRFTSYYYYVIIIQYIHLVSGENFLKRNRVGLDKYSVLDTIVHSTKHSY